MRALLVSCFAFLLATSAAAGPVLVSELLVDLPGRDDGGVFVELYGPAFADLDGYVLVARNGSGGGITHQVSLAGLSMPEDGFLVVADGIDGVTAVPGADLVVDDFDLQNGPESLLLLRDGQVVDAVAYGTFGASHVAFGEGDPAPTGGAGTSLARRFSDVDTDDNLADFRVLDTPTPGTGDLFLAEPESEPEPVPDPASAPEPATAVLVGLGGLAVGWVRTRRAR